MTNGEWEPISVIGKYSGGKPQEVRTVHVIERNSDTLQLRRYERELESIKEMSTN